MTRMITRTFIHWQRSFPDRRWKGIWRDSPFRIKVCEQYNCCWERNENHQYTKRSVYEQLSSTTWQRMKAKWNGVSWKAPTLSDWSQRIADLSFIVRKRLCKKCHFSAPRKAPAGVWFIKRLKMVLLNLLSWPLKPLDNIEQTFTQRKRKSRNFQKAKLKLPKMFALKQSNALQGIGHHFCWAQPNSWGQQITDQDEYITIRLRGLKRHWNLFHPIGQYTRCGQKVGGQRFSRHY